MPKLIRLTAQGAVLADDRFTFAPDDESVPKGDVIVSLKRFQAEGDALQAEARDVGVRIEAGEAVEALAYDLPAIPVVELVFPKFNDGRAYSAASLLRQRYRYAGEVRAVGEVLREQAGFMARCGFDAFQPSDGSTPEQWTKATHRFRHVYQHAADARPTAYEERAAATEGQPNAV